MSPYPNSQLCTFPNATHTVPYNDPHLFDESVERFFRGPIVKRDRHKDLVKSYEAMEKSLQ
jgi:hypothetical protein